MDITTTANDATRVSIRWNTGRKYRADGQPIAATWRAWDGIVTFYDHALMIYAEINDPLMTLPTPEGLRQFVTREYDAGRYGFTARAAKDSGTVNSQTAKF